MRKDLRDLTIRFKKRLLEDEDPKICSKKELYELVHYLEKRLDESKKSDLWQETKLWLKSKGTK